MCGPLQKFLFFYVFNTTTTTTTTEPVPLKMVPVQAVPIQQVPSRLVQIVTWSNFTLHQLKWQPVQQNSSSGPGQFAFIPVAIGNVYKLFASPHYLIY